MKKKKKRIYNKKDNEVPDVLILHFGCLLDSKIKGLSHGISLLKSVLFG